MINYPEWDDFCRLAWKSFEEKVFSKAASLEPVRSDITYAQVVEAVENYWEQWVNGSVERENTFGKAKEGLALKIYKELHLPAVISIPPAPQKSWVTETDKQCRYYWPLTRKVMIDSMGQGVTDKIDKESENILQHLQDPRKAQQWRVQGLVIGNIQAGKTANYSALISKAADAGQRQNNRQRHQSHVRARCFFFRFCVLCTHNFFRRTLVINNSDFAKFNVKKKSVSNNTKPRSSDRGLLALYLGWQGQKESNPQPTVLETVALPIELYP